MYSTAGAFAPWQANSAMSQHTASSAFIPAPARNTYVSQAGLPPPPPSYVPVPLAGHTIAPYSMALPTPSPVPQARRKPTDWPPDVRDYVSRSFAPESQLAGVTKQEVETKLKQVITEAANSNQLDSLNWGDMPLPQQMIHTERNRSILTPHMQAFLPSAHSSDVQHYSSPFQSQSSSQSKPEILRKRKSSELGAEPDGVAGHPWTNNTGNTDDKTGLSLEDRVTYVSTPDKRPRLDLVKSHSKSLASLEQRKKRFEGIRDGSNSPRKQPSHHVVPPAEPIGPVVGRSQKLEKNYFRLTSAPNPDDVRPLHILRQTLELLKKKWRIDANYVYICDQFKSLRQDLTVQHIRNDFTTMVYEIHARIALEKGDLGEYNQCQTQLRALYKQGLGGHPSEFVAYRILYLIHTCNRTDMNDVLSDLTPADKAEPAVQHALEVRSALALGNYHKFFKLYLAVPNMGGYLMDMSIERERLAALSRICRAYKPDVRLRFITEELAFESDEETARFILDHAAENLLHEKDDHVRLLTGKAGQVFEQARQAAFQQVDIKGQI